MTNGNQMTNKDTSNSHYKLGFTDAVSMAHDICGPFIRDAKTPEEARTAAAIGTLIANLIMVVKP